MHESSTSDTLPGQDERGQIGVPLVVDLDGTLIRTDLLHETASAFLSSRPWEAHKLLGWLGAGKLRLKSELADRHVLEPSSLPYHGELLDFLRAEHDRGRMLVLATASTSGQAAEVAQHLGMFDSVIGSTDEVNLKASAKRALLVEKFGEGGFDYVGNHADDSLVWKSAAHAYVVSSDRRLIGTVERVARVFPSHQGSRRSALVRAMRPHQWVKNFLVLLALFTAQRFADAESVLRAAAAFVAFSLTASSVYLFNDIADVASDRHHPTKRRRPFAAGDVSLLAGWVAWPLLLACSFAVSLTLLPGYFTATLLGYLVLTLLYTVDLKRRLIVDAIALSLLYTIRVIAGAAAIQTPLSFFLLTFSLFFFLSLAFIKRVSELSRARSSGASIRGRGYVSDDLELLSSFGTTAGYAAVVVFALYINDPRTAILYETPELLWASVPLLLFWISRAWLVAHRGNMDEDPILYAVRDRVSLVVGLLVAVVFVAAKTLSL